MHCPMPWCEHTEPHHHVPPMGHTFPADLPLPYRRDYARRAGWPADVAERWARDPYAPEFRTRRRQRYTDAEILPPEAFRTWLTTRDPADIAPPLAIAPEEWFEDEPESDHVS